MTTTRYYVGYKKNGGREVFSATSTPTERTHGASYFATVGPFRTKRGATYMANNPGPCVITVSDAERFARHDALMTRAVNAGII